MADDVSMEAGEAEGAPVASTSASTSVFTHAPASTAGPSSIQSRSHIRAGDTILLELPSKAIRLVKLSTTSSTNIIHLGRYGSFDAAKELIGQPYGVTLEIVAPGKTNGLQDDNDEEEENVNGNGNGDDKAEAQEPKKGKRKMKKENAKIDKGKDVQSTSSSSGPGKELCTLKRLDGVSLEEIEVTQATNEKIKATGAKTMDPEEILELKRQGVSGREIIERQIASHEAFALKNEYSKAKYKNRKEAKYLKFVTPLPPTIHNVCQYYFDLEPKRIRDLRPDTLAQMLALGNVRPGSRVIVVDDASGLVTAAVAERMAGEGTILILHSHDSPPPNQSLPLLNMPDSYSSPAVMKSLHWGWTDENWQSIDLPTEPELGEEVHSERQRQRLKRRKGAQDALKETVKEYTDGEFDAVLISSHYETMSILKRVLPALGGSAQIVVQSPVLQTLSELLRTLMDLRSILNPTIIEPWIRQFQVLPGRTHPTMNGIGHGGYLLHATRVFDDELANSARSGGGVSEPSRKRRR